MARDLYYEIDEKGTGYYIKDRDDELSTIYQYPPFIPFPKDTIQESAQAHLDNILQRDAEAEKERITIEKLHKELTELKTLNSEQDDIIFEQSYEIAMLKLNTASAAV